MDLAAARTIDASLLPGLSLAAWRDLSCGPRHVVPPMVWSTLPPPAKIEEERGAVRELFARKDAGYVRALDGLAEVMPAMSPAQRIGIVMPAYNEQSVITTTLDLLVRQSTSRGGLVDPSHFGVTVVVNRPVTDDPQREGRDRANLMQTVVAITNYQAAHPEIDLQYVVVEAPRAVAGVGLARMVGHDLAALRSSRRERQDAPFYIQTMDADTPRMNPRCVSILLESLDRDGYSKDFYRQAPTLPLQDMRRYPLLHAMDFLWTDTIRAIAENTDSAWTAGAGILVSLYAHAGAGGIFPFRLNRGVDEDLRIGIHARLRRESGDITGQGQIEEPIYETDPRRVILVIGDLLQTLGERGLLTERGPLTRDIHDIATLLRSYLDFHETEIRVQNSPHHDSLDWLATPEAFARAVPPQVVEVIANSYRELMRVEVSLDCAKRQIQKAASVYEGFTSGQSAYSIMRGTYNHLELEFASDGSFESPDREVMEEIFRLASDRATNMMVRVLRDRGFEVAVDDADPAPPGALPTDILASPIRIISSEGYRERLAAHLAQHS